MALLEPAFDDYAVGLPNPGQLETPAEILAALQQLEAEESQIDEELSAMMGDRALLETLLDRIDSVRPVVEQVQLEAGELARRVDETADVAERISGKVRQLDLEQVSVAHGCAVMPAVLRHAAISLLLALYGSPASSSRLKWCRLSRI